MAGDAATVSVRVAVPRGVAFSIFTEEIDRWWRRTGRYRSEARSIVHLESRAGGRLFESIGDRVIETGRVLTWEPPARFSMEWRNVNFAPEEKTLVEVTFAEVEGGTMVTVKHSGWSALRDDHPARHGKLGTDFTRMIGMWWADLLGAYRESAHS